MSTTIDNFIMPRYKEIPDVGLYLEQTVKYINGSLAPLGCMEITTSMVSNYVKQGYIERPVKKQYNREQIAYLLFIAVIKNVLSMENILTLFEIQKADYSAEHAYEYFCEQLESILADIFNAKGTSAPPSDCPEELKMLRSAIIAAANIIYLNDCFEKRKQTDVQE